jgi:4-amino-4-deoxy-L-arabinose transferase-like glycosyltransferase
METHRLERERKKMLIWACFLALLFFTARLAYIPLINLSPDEAYYWQWSRHPAISYYDQGPMLALAIRFGTFLFGNNELGVRFPAALSGLVISALAIWFCYRILNQPRAAMWAVLALNGMLLYAVGGILMVHDSLQVVFWALALACLELAIDGPGLGWWIGFGFWGGLGILSKYTGVFLFPLAGLALLSHSELRPKLKSAGPWLALLLGVFSGIPILVWNAQNQWASAGHVLYIGGANPARHSLTSLPQFLGSQLGLVTPILFILILLVWWDGLRKRWLDQMSPQEWILWCCSFPLFLFFLCLSILTKVAGNWPAPAYFGAALLLVASLQRRQRLNSTWVRWGLIVAFSMTVLVHWQAASPFLPISQSRAGLDSASRVDGWRNLARQVDTLRMELPGKSFVGTKTYQMAAELGFYLPGQPRTLIIQDQVINNEYRFWNHPEGHVGQNAILVVEQDREIGEMMHRFDKVEFIEDLPVFRNGIEVQRYHLFRGISFKG